MLRPAWSADHMHRAYDSDDGMPVDPVFAVDVDARGRIWTGGPSGVTLLDGSRIRQVHPEVVSVRIESLAACGPAVWAVGWGQGGWRVDEERAIALVDGEGALRRAAMDVTCFDGGVILAEREALWSVEGTADTDPQLHPFPAPSDLLSERVRSVRGFTDRLIVGTDRGVWEWRAQAWRRLFDAEVVVDTWVDGEAVSALEYEGRLVEFAGAGPTERLTVHARGISLIGRKGTLWVGTDQGLIAVRPDGSVGFTEAPAVPSGGSLAVGREGELLLGSFGGLLVFPEPDTRTLGLGDGLPNAHARFVVGAADGVWLSTWQGMALVRPWQPSEHSALLLRGVDDPAEQRRRRASVDREVSPVTGAIVRTRPCVDGDGHVWAAGALEREHRYAGHAIGRWDGRQMDWRPLSDPDDWVWGCAADRHGDVWFWSRAAAWRAVDGAPPVPQPGAGTETDLMSIRLAPDGSLVLIGGTELCWIPPSPRGELEPPRCTSHSTGAHYDAAWLPDGTLLVATGADGLLTGPDADQLAPALDAAGQPLLRSREAVHLSASPRGGVWVATAADRARVEPTDGAWRVVERLEAWQGVPGVGANAIVELPGGDVWVTGWRGAAHVPASSREVSPPPAVPFLSAIEVDGRPIEAADLARTSGAAWRITLGAPGFRDPDRRRFRARLDGAISAPSPIPVFQLFGLSPGRHTLVLEASGGGDTWTALPEALGIRVPAAWYQRWEPYGAVTAFLAAGAWAAHRARVRRAVELERQRLRIAMDLHDDLGSGLGSVGLLASLAADAEIEPATARSAAARIAHIAATLGDALSDIVWSLRPESGSTGALALRLREQAHRLVPGPRPRLELDVDLPEIHLDPAVCRAAHRIAVEALWNAVKHANAAVIQLRLRAEGGQLRLEVRDDGAGLRAPSASGRPSSGLGHRGMARRAEDIGATLTIGPNGDAGTAVTLTFDTQVRGGPP